MKKTNKANKTNKTNKANFQSVPESRNENRESKTGQRATSNTFTIAIVFLFILFCYWMLAVRNSYMMQWYEEMSLFEPTRFFFRQCLYFPGGLLYYSGAWLTQLFYYPFLGATVLVILWLATAWLLGRAFRLPKEAFPLALVVPLVLLASIVQIDDAWLSMKSVGYMYSNTLGFLLVAFVLWLYRICEKRPPVAAGVLLVSAICYFFLGFYGLFAAFIGIIFMVTEIVRNKKYVNLTYPAAVLAVILILPRLYYTHFRETTVDNDYLYIKGLPDFLIEHFDLYLWIPFIVATTFLLLLAIFSAVHWLPAKPWLKWIGIAAVCICGVWCLKVDRKNEQLRATVLMLKHLEHNDWQGMASVMANIKEPPNYTMKVLSNFATVNLGGQETSLDKMKPRNIDARHAEGFSMTAFVNVPINYYIGKTNLSYRWGMEHCVQYGKRVFFIKYMVKSALLNGDVELAKKYNDLLLGTLFHREWAQEMNRYIEDPSLIDSNVEFNCILEVMKKDSIREQKIKL